MNKSVDILSVKMGQENGDEAVACLKLQLFKVRVGLKARHKYNFWKA